MTKKRRFSQIRTDWIDKLLSALICVNPRFKTDSLLINILKKFPFGVPCRLNADIIIKNVNSMQYDIG